MNDVLDPAQQRFLEDHQWAVLATVSAGGAPQQSMVGYATDAEGRIVISTKAFTAKWRNALARPQVSLTVVDGHAHLAIAGTAEAIDADPERAELSADVFARLADTDRPDPSSLVATLDEQERTVIRITPSTAHFHE
jgi:PPOX class probable F420-dependent enzyme